MKRRGWEKLLIDGVDLRGLGYESKAAVVVGGQVVICLGVEAVG